MTLKKQLKNTIGRKATRRLYKAAPWVGAAVALGVGGAVSRSGSLEGVKEKARGVMPSRRSEG
jgi:hypothetical protein